MNFAFGRFVARGLDGSIVYRGTGLTSPQPIEEKVISIQISEYHAHWKEWHKQTEPTPSWIDDWLNQIPGGCGCGAEFRDWVLKNSPRFDDWFAYSVEGHNAVNRKLGKPELSLDEAKAIWQ